MDISKTIINNKLKVASSKVIENYNLYNILDIDALNIQLFQAGIIDVTTGLTCIQVKEAVSMFIDKYNKLPNEIQQVLINQLICNNFS